MKSFRETMNGSLARNSTKLARFCTAFVTSFKVRSATREGVSVEVKWILLTDRDTMLKPLVAIETHSIIHGLFASMDQPKEVPSDLWQFLELWWLLKPWEPIFSGSLPKQTMKGSADAACYQNLASNLYHTATNFFFLCCLASWKKWLQPLVHVKRYGTILFSVLILKAIHWCSFEPGNETEI